MVCWFSSFWHHFDLAKQVKFGVSRHFPEITWRECPEILHADVSWPPSALISYSHGLLIFLNLALFWLGETTQCYPDVSRRMHWGNSLKFCMLMYPDHLQNWLDFGQALLIFLMVPIWLSETGHIWGLQGLSGQRLGVNVEWGSGGIFPMLCVEFRLVYFYTNVQHIKNLKNL